MEQDQAQSMPHGVPATQYATPDMQAQAMPVQEGPFALGLAADAGRASNIAWTTIPPMHPLSGPLVQMFKVRGAVRTLIKLRCCAFGRSPEPGLWATAQALPEWPPAGSISPGQALCLALRAPSGRRRCPEHIPTAGRNFHALLTSYRQPVSSVVQSVKRQTIGSAALWSHA